MKHDELDDMASNDTTDAKIYAEEFLEIVRDGVPIIGRLGLSIEAWEAGRVKIRLPYSDLIRRPGGTVSGPAIMGLADVSLYGAVMTLIGRADLAVTTDLTFHFLSRPKPADLIADGRILKLGRRLAVGDIMIYSDGKPQPVCQASGSYAIPPAID